MENLRLVFERWGFDVRPSQAHKQVMDGIIVCDWGACEQYVYFTFEVRNDLQLYKKTTRIESKWLADFPIESLFPVLKDMIREVVEPIMEMLIFDKDDI